VVVQGPSVGGTHPPDYHQLLNLSAQTPITVFLLHDPTVCAGRRLVGFGG
jgi:hypothetical protein